MTRVVCPGSFDPVTFGHLDIIGRAAGLFDEVIVAVGANTTKKTGMFTVAERVAMLRTSCKEWPQVEIDTFSGLLVDYCRTREATAVVKGLRFAKDFEYELPMAHMNAQMSDLETVFLPTSAQWGAVSSTLIREIATLGGDVTPFLPAEVARRTTERARARRTAQS
ncbi:pantetheine-phosphate adenylyltransferase [Propionibacteriaceae bacterium Y2011]|uniref:pantetheine-phosphate adenylyltransferase n=1 Tax=Microlunatus sp. Y2014 TaxID=3418488 RepID=UPI003B4BF0B6